MFNSEEVNNKQHNAVAKPEHDLAGHSKNYAALDVVLREARAWLHSLSRGKVGASASLSTLREKIDLPLPSEGASPTEVVEHLVAATRDGLVASAGGRFFAWVMGGSLPAALAADWLVSSWDQNSVLYDCSPASSVIEETTGKWLLELLDLPSTASFAFTTGCQMAHFTCLAAARQRLLAARGWDVTRDGMRDAPPLKIITSEYRHASVDRAVRYLGLGEREIISVKTDKRGVIHRLAFDQALHDCGDVAKLVVLDAADLNIAAFDSFADLIPSAQAHKAWVHVDGAFGLFARASQRKKHLTAGIELADSWATDMHKWLNVPFDCGFAAVRDNNAHREAMSVHAAYIDVDRVSRNQIDWSPEWSRRARSVPVYAALMQLGKEGVADLVERTCRCCAELIEGIGSLPGTEIVWQSELNQGLLRFHDPRPDADAADHDRRTWEVMDAVNSSGEAFFSSTVWRGNFVMRVSVVNWLTNSSDVQRVIATFRQVLTSPLK